MRLRLFERLTGLYTRFMREFELYVPLFRNDGTPIDPTHLDSLKSRLVSEFGGLTLFPQANEGLWKVGTHQFRDRIIIIRVLAECAEKAGAFFTNLKPELQTAWQQDAVLIVSRQIELI